MSHLTISEIISYDGDVGQSVFNYLTLSFVLLCTLAVTCFVPVNSQTKILERTLSIPLFATLFSIQIGFYYALGILGVSLVWSGLLGCNTRQFCFYYDWIRSKYVVMYMYATSIILAAINYVYTAVVTRTPSVLYMMIVSYMIGLILGILCYRHVSKQENRSTTVRNYLSFTTF